MRTLLVMVALLCAQSALAELEPELYYVAFLRPDPDRKPLAKDEGDRLQSAHMANIHRMADAGVLVAAGPFEDQPTTISGLFLFRTASLPEAQRTAAQDPTVVAHRNTIDVHPWWGPKGIGEEYKRLHKADPKTPEGMGVQPLFLISRGDRWQEAAAELQEHAAYLARLQKERKIAMWGPTKDDREYEAFTVFDRIPDEQAKSLMAKDPAVSAGVLRAEFHRWWCAEHVIPR